MSGKWLEKSLHTAVASLGLATNQKEFDKLTKRLGLRNIEWITNGAGGYTHQLVSASGDYAHIVCIDKKRHGHCKKSILGTLVHESVHVWQLHCELIGEKKPSMEFEAYGVQHIFLKLEKELN